MGVGPRASHAPSNLQPRSRTNEPKKKKTGADTSTIAVALGVPWEAVRAGLPPNASAISCCVKVGCGWCMGHSRQRLDARLDSRGCWDMWQTCVGRRRKQCVLGWPYTQSGDPPQEFPGGSMVCVCVPMHSPPHMVMVCADTSTGVRGAMHTLCICARLSLCASWGGAPHHRVRTIRRRQIRHCGRARLAPSRLRAAPHRACERRRQWPNTASGWSSRI